MRKKKTIIEENLPDADTTNGGADVSDIICVLSKVYKLNSGVRAFCFQTETPVDEVSIQAQYPNGGKFVVVEFNGLAEILNTTNYEIEPKPMAVSPNGNGNGSSSDFQMRLLMDEIAWTRNMLLESIRRGNSTQQTPLLEMVQAMQGIHALAPGGNSNPVDLIVKGLELGTKMNGGGGASDWKQELIQVAKEVAPQIIPMFTKQPQQPTTTMDTTHMIAPDNTTIIKSAIQWIKSRIIGGMEPGLAVAWLTNNANDPQYQPMLAMAIQGNIDTFIGIDPEIANEPYRGWFTATINELKEWYGEQTDNSTDNDGGNGNDTNVAVNEKPRSAKPKIERVV